MNSKLDINVIVEPYHEWDIPNVTRHLGEAEV